MTIAARGFLMATNQRAIGEVVIESIFIENDDGEVTPFVIGVTICATANFGVIKQPVKAHLLVDVTTDVLVTVNTQAPASPVTQWSVR